MSIIIRKDSLAAANLNLLESEEYADLTFLVGPEKQPVKAHRLILAARSPFLKAVFSTAQAVGSTDDLISVPDTCVDQFKAFLMFMYADKFVAKDVPEITSLLELGSKFQVESLLSKCDRVLISKFAKKQSVREVYSAARFCSRNVVMSNIEETISRQFRDFSKSQEFLDIDRELLQMLLMRDDLHIDEIGLFKAVMRWGEAQLQNETYGRGALASILESVLPLIRFPTMTLNQFASVVRPTNSLTDADMVDIYTYLSSTGDQKRKLGRTLKFNTIPRGGTSNGDHSNDEQAPASPDSVTPSSSSAPRLQRDNETSSLGRRPRRQCQSLCAGRSQTESPVDSYSSGEEFDVNAFEN